MVSAGTRLLVNPLAASSLPQVQGLESHLLFCPAHMHRIACLFYALSIIRLSIHEMAQKMPPAAARKAGQQNDQFLHPCLRRQEHYESRARRYSKGRTDGSYQRVSFPTKGSSPGFREFVFVRLTLQMSGRLTSRCRQFASKCNRLRDWQVDQGQEQA